jgi:hypothetical protein
MRTRHSSGEGPIDRTIGVEAGDAIERHSVHGGEFAADEDTAIGLESGGADDVVGGRVNLLKTLPGAAKPAQRDHTSIPQTVGKNTGSGISWSGLPAAKVSRVAIPAKKKAAGFPAALV